MSSSEASLLLSRTRAVCRRVRSRLAGGQRRSTRSTAAELHSAADRRSTRRQHTPQKKKRGINQNKVAELVDQGGGSGWLLCSFLPPRGEERRRWARGERGGSDVFTVQQRHSRVSEASRTDGFQAEGANQRPPPRRHGDVVVFTACRVVTLANVETGRGKTGCKQPSHSGSQEGTTECNS